MPRVTFQPQVMGKFTVSAGLKTLGWAAALAMLGSVIGMAVTAIP